MPITLHQFAFSHFNEKVRWSLAFKGIPHQRETYLPGPHLPAIRRISGQSSTPVLQVDQEYLSGSAAIIDRLEQDHPKPALYPESPELRTLALELQTRLDGALGPAVRTVIFSALVNDGAYLCRMFGGSKSLLKRIGYRAMFPLARPVISKTNGVTADNVRRCFDVTSSWLDEIADTGSGDYLVGDSFGIADLTAAALLAPIASVGHPDMKRPEPIPAAVQEIIARFAAHPTIHWVNGVYEKHRPA